MMRQIFVLASGLCDWKARLAAPDLHWKRERSAFELAVTWEAAAKTARGLPPQVAELLDTNAILKGAYLLLAVPEHKVALEGIGKASQTDVWALLKTPSGLASLAVEGKAGEPFDKTVKEWDDGSSNRQTRLQGLCRTLGLSVNNVSDLRYQLLHRAASAVLEAQRFGASEAVLVVQSFGTAAVGFNDFALFAAKLGAGAITQGQLCSIQLGSVRLSAGWLDCPYVTDAQITLSAV